MDSKTFADKITSLIFNKKGYDVKILDLTKLTAFADYFIICSADSTTQVKAVADEIDKELRDEGIKYWHKEGYKALNWVLIDYVDVVVHIFKRMPGNFITSKSSGETLLLKRFKIREQQRQLLKKPGQYRNNNIPSL